MFASLISDFEGIEVHSRKVFNVAKEKTTAPKDSEESIGPMVRDICAIKHDMYSYNQQMLVRSCESLRHFHSILNVGWQKMLELWSRGHDLHHTTNKVGWWGANSVLWLSTVQVSTTCSFTNIIFFYHFPLLFCTSALVNLNTCRLRFLHIWFWVYIVWGDCSKQNVQHLQCPQNQARHNILWCRFKYESLWIFEAYFFIFLFFSFHRIQETEYS